jgi:hypothetical protein
MINIILYSNSFYMNLFIIAMNYQESKCEHVIQKMVRCCEIYGAKSECCAGFLKGQRKPKPDAKT